MPPSSYFGQAHPKAADTAEFNAINGSDAEVYAAAHLNIACGGEISWGSREEDGQKIDLLLSIRQPWEPSGRLIVLAQVKSGPTYGTEYQNEKGELCVSLTKTVLEKSFTPTHDLLLIWVNRATGNCFWVYVKAGQKPYKRELGRRSLISPALKFDLCRIIYSRKPDGGKGLVFKTKDAVPQLVRKESYKLYKKYALSRLQSPLFGEVKFTKMGWRHLTSISRLNLFRKESQQIIPIVDKLIVRSPSYHIVETCDFSERKEWSYRDTVYLLVYENVRCVPFDSNRGEIVIVYLKIHESIIYPKNWKTTVQRGQLVQRECKFLSVYYKRKNKNKEENSEGTV